LEVEKILENLIAVTSKMVTEKSKEESRETLRKSTRKERVKSIEMGNLEKSMFR
jgi:hypothetical protein